MNVIRKLKTAFSPGKRAQSESAPAERLSHDRTIVRKRQRMKDGYISSEGMLTPRACTIREMSALCARIELWNDDIKPALLRGELKLYSCADQSEVDCTMTWRQGASAEVRFAGKFHPPTRRYPH